MKLTPQIKRSLFDRKTKVLAILLPVTSEDYKMVGGAQNTAHVSSYRSIWVKIPIWIDDEELGSNIISQHEAYLTESVSRAKVKYCFSQSVNHCYSIMQQ